MTVRIKALGLAIAAVAALNGVVVSAAQAGELDVGATVTPAVIVGVTEAGQEPQLTIQKQTGGQGSFNGSCSQSTLEGTTSGEPSVDEVTATAIYEGECELFGQEATIRMNGCKYTLTWAGQEANTAVTDLSAAQRANKLRFNLSPAKS